MSPSHAWTIARLAAGYGVNGELDALPGDLRRSALYLSSVAVDRRQEVWETIVATHPDGEELARAVAAVDPLAVVPPAEERPRIATLADLSEVNESGRFLWPSWIVRNHFTLITSEPKVGKTRIGLELAKRLWFGSAWPDGQANTLPEGTVTLWVPGDRNQDELREMALAYGLPLEAVLLNATADDAYSGCNLDDPRSIDTLRSIVETAKPAIVFIDTVWRATHRKMSREDEVNALFDPILSIAQEGGVAIVGMMHASKEGETLGRRLEGLARGVIKLTCPDPAGQLDRRKFWVERANFRSPSPLGVTMVSAGCEFDHAPPEAPAETPRRGGRPDVERGRAKAFLVERLTARNDQTWNELKAEWEGQGGCGRTFKRAVDAMKEAGLLATEGGQGTRTRMVLHLLDEAVAPQSGQNSEAA